jgi:hypothetical protein
MNNLSRDQIIAIVVFALVIMAGTLLIFSGGDDDPDLTLTAPPTNVLPLDVTPEITPELTEDPA